jgi:hypothetical protein
MKDGRIKWLEERVASLEQQLALNQALQTTNAQSFDAFHPNTNTHQFDSFSANTNAHSLDGFPSTSTNTQSFNASGSQTYYTNFHM